MDFMKRLAFGLICCILGVGLGAIVYLIIRSLKRITSKSIPVILALSVVVLSFTLNVTINTIFSASIFVYLLIGMALSFMYLVFKKKDSGNYLDWLVREQSKMKTVNNLAAQIKFAPCSMEKEEKLKAALDRAWKCRDFEINKLWQRSLLFWGVIGAIFTGYSSAVEKCPNSYRVLYLILAGYLFSLAGFLVIKANRTWELNWEIHIDYLENAITGPLHKTLFYKKNTVFYSIAGINEVLSFAAIIFWLGLLFHYFYENNQCKIASCFADVDLEASVAIVVAVIFSIVLIFGYPRYPFSADKSKVPEDGVFINRRERTDIGGE